MGIGLKEKYLRILQTYTPNPDDQVAIANGNWEYFEYMRKLMEEFH
jgi:hypothetical protein